MRNFFIFMFIGVLLQLNAQKANFELPPAEMIMMDFSDEDDVESIDFEQESTEKVDNTIVELEQIPSVSSGNSVKIALLAPKKVIGAYADSVSNSILAYLIFKNAEFVFEVFDSVNEDELAIVEKLGEIKNKGYDFVIAPYTKTGAEIIIQNNMGLLVFIPTINKQQIVDEVGANIIFGGIDYKRQIDLLLGQVNDKVVLFGDGSSVSTGISDYINERVFEKIVYSKDIINIRTNLSSFLKRNKKIKKSSIFLNMPIVKSSLLASQFTQYKVEPYTILSTQFNYNPLIFKLTQYKDREFFYIANSIDFQDERLKDINLILGNNPNYNWIDYSTSIGLDYIYANMISMTDRVFGEDIYDNQIEYKVRLERVGRSSFIPVGNGKYHY